MKLGINSIPVTPVSGNIEIVQTVESNGYEYCLLADEGMTPDIWVTLGLAARESKKIFLGPVTNGYTRHPAVTAIAMSTVKAMDMLTERDPDRRRFLNHYRSFIPKHKS